MKWLTFILSIYLIGLSCIPCGDSRDCNDEQTVQKEIIAGHSDHEHEQETCTPFCVCACCSTAINLVSLYFYSFSTEHPAPTYTGYALSLPPQISFSIWQPPKIG